MNTDRDFPNLQLHQPSDQHRRQAARHVLKRAHNPHDAAELLDMLGLGDTLRELQRNRGQHS
ncbi:hypothetical protein [Actinopolyspora halophila]|uniref:hypothetical protein n=1 Tax=Actinopolyspora halophila TaxID=1850 RepID=UPI000381E408|nr:hypothetical protein [Actinopolyspora halophila]